MSTTKELGEAWFGCQAEIKHLKAVLKLKETHILTLKEYIRKGRNALIVIMNIPRSLS